MFVVNRVPIIVERSPGTESMDSWRNWYLLLMHLSSLRSLVMRDTVLRLFATSWNYCMYILMVVEIACAVIVDQFSHLVSFVVRGYIAQLCNAIGLGETGASCYGCRLIVTGPFYAKLSYWWRNHRQQFYHNPPKKPLTKQYHRCTRIIRDMDINHLLYPWNFFTHLHNFSYSTVNLEDLFVQIGKYLLYIMSHNITQTIQPHASLQHARAFIRKTWPWGKLLQISWGTLIQCGTRNKCIPEQH